MSSDKILPENDTPKEVAIASSLIPWRKDDNRSRYLGYLACGFNPDEALYMMGLGEDWLEEQRSSNDFAVFELRVPEIRKELSREYIEIDFFRNFRMVLEKDRRVLRASLELDADGDQLPMSPLDQQYLLKLRSAYTPQQLQILSQAVASVGKEDFNFSKWVQENQDVIEVSRTETVRRIKSDRKTVNYIEGTEGSSEECTQSSDEQDSD